MNYTKRVERYHKILKLRKKGFTLREISKLFSISQNGVYVYIKRGEPRPIHRNRNTLWDRVSTSSAKGRGRARMLVRFRDNFSCQDCGAIRTPEETRETKKRLFDIHHLNGLCGKKSRGYDSTKDLSGLITLCHKCHFNRPEHRVKSPTFRKGF